MEQNLLALTRELQHYSDSQLLLLMLGVSAVLNAVLATALLRLTTMRFRGNRFALWLLFFSFGLFIPTLGSVGLAGALLYGLWRPIREHKAPFERVDSPEFDLLKREEGSRYDRGGLRARLEQSALAPEVRMQSVVALQNMPTSVASPILRNLLGDSTDDIRLVAFGMLDGEEKKITHRIHQLLPQLEKAKSDKQRYRLTRTLAELYWELAYSGMVQGDLRRYTLEQAYNYVQQAAALQDNDAGLLFLAARIQDGLECFDDAERTMLKAVMQGLPSTRALPYLAEFAYERKDFSQVRFLMNEIAGSPVTPRLLPIVEYWTQGQRKESPHV